MWKNVLSLNLVSSLMLKIKYTWSWNLLKESTISPQITKKLRISILSEWSWMEISYINNFSLDMVFHLFQDESIINNAHLLQAVITSPRWLMEMHGTFMQNYPIPDHPSHSRTRRVNVAVTKSAPSPSIRTYPRGGDPTFGDK